MPVAPSTYMRMYCHPQPPSKTFPDDHAMCVPCFIDDSSRLHKVFVSMPFEGIMVIHRLHSKFTYMVRIRRCTVCIPNVNNVVRASKEDNRSTTISTGTIKIRQSVQTRQPNLCGPPSCFGVVGYSPRIGHGRGW